MSESDKKRLDAAYADLENARDSYKAGSEKYNAIDDALKAFGKPGEVNGVTVFALPLATPGSTSGILDYGLDDGLTDGKATINVVIDLSRFKTDDVGKASLAGALGHEGTHVKDFQSEAAKLKGLTSFEVKEASTSGKIMSKAITEVNAYRLSSYVAEAISPEKVKDISVNKSAIWKRGWKKSDEEVKRNAGIRGVLESKTGSYKYTFTGTNSDRIDDPRNWSGAKPIY